MTNIITQTRIDLKNELEADGINAEYYIPPRITPPLAIISPDTNYVSQGDTFASFGIGLTITLITQTKSNEKDKDSEEYQLNALAPVTIPLEFVTKQITKGAGKVGKELKKIGKGMFNFKDKEKDDRLKKAREDKDNEDNNQSLNENIQRIKKSLK